MSTPKPWKPPEPLPSRRETERLEIRFFEHRDAPSLFEAFEAERASPTPWLTRTSTDCRTVDEAHEFVAHLRRLRTQPEATDYAMGIFDRTSGEYVGMVGFHRLSLARSEAEVGYWIRVARRGQGLVTEAAAALITAGFSPQDQGGWGFRRITLFCAELNVASVAVPKKLGMRLEARMKARDWIDTLGYVDMLTFAALADEWDFERKRAKPGIGWSAPIVG